MTRYGILELSEYQWLSSDRCRRDTSHTCLIALTHDGSTVPGAGGLPNPRKLKRRTAGLFHILDQGYAHLIRALDPERTVITCHDLIPLLATRGLIPGAVPARVSRLFQMQVACLERARMIVSVSSATKTTLERYTSVESQRIAVVPLGVNPTFRFLPNARSARRAGISSPITMSRYRNMTTSNAAPMDAIYEICGEPPYSLESGIAETVHWLRVHHPQLVATP